MSKPFTYIDMINYGIPVKLILSWMIVLLPFISFSQVQQPGTQPDTTKNRIILIDYIGKYIEDTEGPETVKWISQEVQFRIDSTYIYADSAVIFGEDRIFAYGNVVIQQGDSLNVFTDTLYYYKATDIADLRGEVTLEQGTKQLWTKNLVYHLGDRYGEYSEGGVMVDKSLQVSSKRGIYYAGEEEVVFKDSVVVLHPEFNLAADSMKYRGAESTVLFTGPTNIYTPSAKIYCESGYYNLITETAEFNSNAQYAGDQKKATADTIRYLAGNKEVVMLGHVLVEEADKQIDASSLRYLEKTGETWIYGEPAIYKDSTRSINSPEIFYNEKTSQVSTKGYGVISDGDLLMRAENSVFDQATGMGMATGRVMWSDTAQDIGIRSDTIQYSKKSDYVLAYGATRPIFYTLVEGDTLFIAADTLNMMNETDSMEVADTNRIIRAYHDVRLFKSDMAGRSDSLSFNTRDSLFTFFGQPVLWADTTQFSADTIEMSIKNKQIHDIILTQKAMIVSELYQLYYDQIKGKTIIAHFDSSEIKEMWVTGNAESVYYTRDDDDAFIGVNQTICSKMFFTFLQGQIHILKYYGDNSSKMMPMAEVNHDTLRLEGFQWRSTERPLTVNDLLK